MQATPTRRLHLGCGDHTPPGWTHVDDASGARAAKRGTVRRWARRVGIARSDDGGDVRIHDLRRRFPWRDASIDAIYCTHALERLTRPQGEYFLFECARVLAPGGTLRVVVNDLTAILSDYERGAFGSTEFVERLGVSAERASDGRWRQRWAPLFRPANRCLYDAEGLLEAMASVGLDARVCAPGRSRIDLGGVARDEGAPGTLIVEGTRCGEF